MCHHTAGFARQPAPGPCTCRRGPARASLAVWLIIGALVLTAVPTLAQTREPQPGEPLPNRVRTAARADGSPDGGGAAVAADDVAPERLLAVVAGQPLLLPHGVTVVGFHEAGARALEMAPTGRSWGNLNPRATTPPDTDGPSYLIMASRRRAGAPTSAVDLAVPHGFPVQSVVTGTVVTVRSYALYGRIADTLVEVVPDGRPDLLVRMLHLEQPLVVPGQRVVAAETPVASSARLLPLRSQIDEYAGRLPHVHVETWPVARPAPGEAGPEAAAPAQRS